jgi:hypothetical protein
VPGREERQAGISSQQQRRSPAAATRGVAGAWARLAPCAERHLLCLMSRQSSTKSFQRRGVVFDESSIIDKKFSAPRGVEDAAALSGDGSAGLGAAGSFSFT